jgi:hypothetical protein
LASEQDNGEKRLWLAVIERAIKDLHSTEWRIQDDARAFLTRPSRDLYMVCDLVDFDARAVMEAARYMEELGESERKVCLQSLLDEDD